jgi:hypothetical protein
VDVALERARIQSHAQLTYAGVQALHDADARGETHPLAEQVYTESLRLLGEVGRLRLAEARARDVVPHRSADVTVEVDGAGQTFRAVVELRRAVDAWNEQVSVMTNVEAALWLARATSPGVQPIFRGHPPPEPGRLDELEATLEATVAARTLDPAVWRWRRAQGESLSDYLARLPEGGPEQRRVDAIHRQAIVAQPALGLRNHGGSAPRPGRARLRSCHRADARDRGHLHPQGAVGAARRHRHQRRGHRARRGAARAGHRGW